MVVIRMARSGKKGDPIYKVMVADKGRPLTGRPLKNLIFLYKTRKTGGYTYG